MSINIIFEEDFYRNFSSYRDQQQPEGPVEVDSPPVEFKPILSVPVLT